MEMVIGVFVLAAWNIVAGVIDATDDRLGFSSPFQEGSGSRPNRRSARYSQRRALQDTEPEPRIRRALHLNWSSAVPRPLNIPTITRLSR
jgi:hypothetical protein